MLFFLPVEVLERSEARVKSLEEFLEQTQKEKTGLFTELKALLVSTSAEHAASTGAPDSPGSAARAPPTPAGEAPGQPGPTDGPRPPPTIGMFPGRSSLPQYGMRRPMRPGMRGNPSTWKLQVPQNQTMVPMRPMARMTGPATTPYMAQAQYQVPPRTPLAAQSARPDVTATTPGHQGQQAPQPTPPPQYLPGRAMMANRGFRGGAQPYHMVPANFRTMGNVPPHLHQAPMMAYQGHQGQLGKSGEQLKGVPGPGQPPQPVHAYQPRTPQQMQRIPPSQMIQQTGRPSVQQQQQQQQQR